MSYVRETIINIPMTVYRGDFLARHHEVSTMGLAGKGNLIEQLAYRGHAPEVQAHALMRQIHKHVLGESQDSPFVSWSRAKSIARNYATRGETRKGLLLTSVVQLTCVHEWLTPEGWAHAFGDSMGRTLFTTQAYSTTELAYTRPGDSAWVRVLGAQDQEFLVLGRIFPVEILAEIATPRRRQSPSAHLGW